MLVLIYLAQPVVGYDMNLQFDQWGILFTGRYDQYGNLSADIYIDRTSIEVFIDGGAYSYSMERKPNSENNEGFHFLGNNIEIKNLEVFNVKSIWK